MYIVGEGPGEMAKLPLALRCLSCLIKSFLTYIMGSPVALMVKNLPVMQENRVRSLGWEDFLEKEIATHSSILAWRIPWTGELDGLQSMGLQRVGHD